MGTWCQGGDLGVWLLEQQWRLTLPWPLHESSEQANWTAPWMPEIAGAPKMHYALDQGVEKRVAGELVGVMAPIPPLAAG